MDDVLFTAELSKYWASTGWSQTTLRNYLNTARKLRNRGIQLST